MKRRLVAGAALAAFFLYLSLRKVNLAEIGEVLRRARYEYLAVLVLLNVAGIWFRSLRWSYLLRPVAALGPRRLLSPLCIGFMSNMVLPVPRAGEFIRAYLVGRKERVSKSAAFATVVVERLFDGLAVISFMALAPLFLDPSAGPIARRLQWAGLLVFLFYVGVFVFLLVMSHHREAMHAFLARSGPVRRWRILGRAAGLLEKFTEGLAILRSTREVAGALALSLAIWSLAAAANYMMMLGIGLHLSLYAPFFLVVVQSFGVMVPSPGFVGPFQYAHIVALGVYGVSQSDAFGLSILIHSGFFFTYVTAGILFLFRENLSWGELREASGERSPGVSEKGTHDP